MVDINNCIALTTPNPNPLITYFKDESLAYDFLFKLSCNECMQLPQPIMMTNELQWN